MTRALAALLLALSACSASPEERRDQTINAALESARLACLTVLANPDIPREPSVTEYCTAVVNGCPR